MSEQGCTKFSMKSPWDNMGNTNPFFNNKKILNLFQDHFDFKKNVNWLLILAVASLLLWLSSGIYKINEGEQAIITRFGRYVRNGSPGLNYHLPSPFEQAFIEKVNQSRRVEIGYRSNSYPGNTYRVQVRQKNQPDSLISAEGIMITGDENIIELTADVMWHIKDLYSFLFNLQHQENTVKSVTESAIREVIGETPIASVLSNQKQEIAEKVELLTQKILDQYSSGIEIEKVQLLKAEPPAEVIDSYRDVQTSKADKEREVNQAQAYANDILPKARGEAAKMLEEAEGYKQSVISQALGNSKRFDSILTEYQFNKQITKDRLYLNAIESILRGSNKTVVGDVKLLPHMAVTQK